MNDPIYNANERGLVWNLLPKKSLVLSNEKNKTYFSSSLNRYNWNFTLSVDYDYSKYALMTSELVI